LKASGRPSVGSAPARGPALGLGPGDPIDSLCEGLAEVRDRCEKGAPALGDDEINGVEIPRAAEAASEVHTTADRGAKAGARGTAKREAPTPPSVRDAKLGDDIGERDVASEPAKELCGDRAASGGVASCGGPRPSSSVFPESIVTVIASQGSGGRPREEVLMRKITP